VRLLPLLFVLAAPLAGQDVFEAELKRPLWLKKSGELRFGAEALEFEAKGADERLRWKYADIQLFDRVTRNELRILTYEDSKWKLSLDRELRFTLTAGEISDELFEQIRARLHRPANDRVLDDGPDEADEPARRLPTKHLHPLGGCEGELLFFEDRIVHASDDQRHNREWRIRDAVEGVWSSDRYRLEIHVREPRAGRPGEIRVWRFQLKQPLEPDLYDRLKRELYELR
jgi:hypothetical protein